MGRDAEVNYYPGVTRHAPGGETEDPAWPMRSDVSLFHELVHAAHNTQGNAAPGPISDAEATCNADVGKDASSTRRWAWAASLSAWIWTPPRTASGRSAGSSPRPTTCPAPA